MARQKIAFGRLWIAPEARQAFTRLASAARSEDLPDASLPPPETEVEIEPSKFVEGGLFVYIRGARLHLSPGRWRLDH